MTDRPIRLTAVLVAFVLFVFAGWIVVSAFTHGELVTPTNGVIGSSRVDDPAEGLGGQQTLTARTSLQRWRAVSGPSPQQPQPAAPTQSTGGPPGTPPETADVADVYGSAVTRGWLAAQVEDAEILQPPRRVEGTSSLPQAERDVFVQPQGRTWRNFRNGPVVFGGGLYLFGVAMLLAIFLAWRGRVRVKEGFAGETVPRFNALERANHWMTAASFSLMGLTGLIILYGREIIRPWLGVYLFDDLAEGSAWLHMSLIVPFALGLLVMVVLWTWQNLPKRIDWIWLKQGGGMLSDEGPNPPAERFNAGQKLIFWSVVLGGGALIVSGLGLMFPFQWAGYTGMQLAQSLHSVTALVMIGIIFGHIYIGTIGMEGAFDAMWSGRVDRNWAREHHNIWYRRLFARDEPRQEPAE